MYPLTDAALMHMFVTPASDRHSVKPLYDASYSLHVSRNFIMEQYVC
jgi:hypothetical protein